MDKKQSKKQYILIFLLTSILFSSVGYFIGKKTNIEDQQKEPVMNRKLDEIYHILKNEWFNTGEEFNLDEAIYQAMVGATKDIHTSYLDKESLTKFDESINKNYDGIGIRISNATGVPIVTEVFTGSTASDAGLLKGDILLGTSEVSFDGLENDQIVDYIKGPNQSEVTLKVRRNQEVLDITVKRAPVDPSAIYEIKQANEKSYGLVTLTAFGSTTAVELKKALDYFKSENIDTITLDLRGNPGGYMQSAKEILDLFLDKDEVEFSIEDKKGTKVVYKSENEFPYQFVNGYILVDKGSASSSEIVAGVLQEILGYKLIGNTTYGKGVAQSQKTLSDLSVLKYTYAKWFLPSGKNLDGIGLTPDHPVDNINISELYNFEIEESLQFDTASLEVSQMQKMLKLLGYSIDRVDGYFNEVTKNILLEFENKLGLKEDGQLDSADKDILIKEVLLYAYHDDQDYQFKKMESLIR